MKILADYWFTDMLGGHIGLVIGEDEFTKERKAYIGTADGYSQAADIKKVSECGQKISASFIEGLLRWLEPAKHN